MSIKHAYISSHASASPIIMIYHISILCHNKQKYTACHMEWKRLFPSFHIHPTKSYIKYLSLSSCTVSMSVLITICHSSTVITLATVISPCLLASDYSMQTVLVCERSQSLKHPAICYACFNAVLLLLH